MLVSFCLLLFRLLKIMCYFAYSLKCALSHFAFWLHHTAHCAENTCRFCVSRKDGTGGGGWGHPQGDMHMVAARLGCQSAMVGTRWANSCPGCMNRLRKCYSHLVEGSFLGGKAAWALSRCLITESAGYCTLINEWAW